MTKYTVVLLFQYPIKVASNSFEITLLPKPIFGIKVLKVQAGVVITAQLGFSDEKGKMKMPFASTFYNYT